MIGARGEGRDWSWAAGLSLAVHAAAIGWLIWRPSLDWMQPPVEPAPDVIQVTPLAVPVVEATPQPAAMQTVTPSAAATVAAVASPILAPISDPLTDAPAPAPLLAPDSAVLTPIPPSGGTESTPATPAAGDGTRIPPPPEPPQPGGPAPDPQLSLLVERIRAQVAEPCMLALPLTREGGGLQLNLLADSDRNLTPLMAELTEGLTGEVTQSAVLLDPRQCPAVTFARRDPQYPLFGLGLTIETPDVPPGSQLRGRLTGGSGFYTTLLLVNDNGVVEELRRFMLLSAGQTRFEFAAIREGAARDTQQLLVAVATPTRPRALTANAGQLAGPFFDALYAEVGQTALVGIAAVNIR